MSLLLDALKKAAKDKQNADSAASADRGNQPDQRGTHDAEKAEDSHPPQDITGRHSNAPGDEPLQLEELELPDDNEIETRTDPYTSTVTATPTTVSDDALRLLIHRTNREYSRSQLALWGSIVLGVIVALLLGGAFYYMDMNNEIQSIERKHRIELAALQSKTRIEENLTSLAEDVRKDDQPEVNVLADKVKPEVTQTTRNERVNTSFQAKPDAGYRIEKTQKEDPISRLLNRGWRAYQHQDYETAREAYTDVLKREPNNQDALLGTAAVAMKQQDYEMARAQYIRLLELDPRDPQAHAGLAVIAQTSGGELSESRLKQLIEYNPDDATLQFTLGNLYVKEGDWRSAQSAYFNAWKKDSLNPDYAFNLAVSLDQLGKQREAERYYRDSIRLAEGKNISFSTAAAQQRLQQIQGYKP